MKTDDLVSLLASGAGAVDPGAARRRWSLALSGGTLVATLLVFAWLEVNPALGRDARAPMFWVKEAFCAALAVGALEVVELTPLGRARQATAMNGTPLATNAREDVVVG